jgi:hypothetical protein
MAILVHSFRKAEKGPILNTFQAGQFYQIIVKIFCGVQRVVYAADVFIETYIVLKCAEPMGTRPAIGLSNGKIDSIHADAGPSRILLRTTGERSCPVQLLASCRALPDGAEQLRQRRIRSLSLGKFSVPRGRCRV